MKKSIYSFFPVFILLIAGGYLISFVHVPYFSAVYNKILNVHEQYTVSKNSRNIELEMKKVQNDIQIIDSLIQIQINRESEIKTGIVEALYTFADSSHLKTSKVEIGEKLNVNGRKETGISVSGTGNFTSIGRFVEKIENYPRSTRIRQLVLKGTEKKSIDGFLDFVLME